MSKISGNEATSISDHLTQFHKIKQKKIILQFCSKGITWNDILQLPSGNPNLYFQISFAKLKAYWIQVPS